MFFDQLKRQVAARRRTLTGQSEPTVWVEDSEHATLIAPESGRVYAYVWHDGRGTYYPTVVVSLWRALYLIWYDAPCVVSFLSFPRCTVNATSLGAETLGLAAQQAQYALGLYG
jgi:hypothetical protein